MTDTPRHRGTEVDFSGTRASRWTSAAYLYALIIAAAIGVFLFRTPFQVSDNVGNMLSLIGTSLGGLMQDQFTAKGFLRPFLWANLKILFDLSDGHYFTVFRAFHAAQVAMLLLLFVRLLQVRRAVDFVACSMALLVLVGGHTFGEFIRQAHPVNTFLSIGIYCLAALNLSVSRGGWWADALAALLFFVAALSVETGLLIWVCLVAAYIAGYRGVSVRGLGAVTALLCAYFFLRFGPLGVGGPGLDERSAGFGFSRLEPDQITARFGAFPLWFYASNVMSSVLTVLFAEPRAGVWELTRAVTVDREVPPWMVITVTGSVVTTLVIVRHAARQWRTWAHGISDHGDRLIVVAAVVLLANAAISYPYTKDVIMSPAGVCYAAAAYVGLRGLLLTASRRAVGNVALAVVLFTASALWAVRVAGLGYNMRYTAFINRNEWVTVFDWLERERIRVDAPGAREFVAGLQREMTGKTVPNLYFTATHVEPYVDPH